MLIDFVDYLNNNTSLSDTSIHHYESGFRTISKQMQESKLISKPLEEMEIAELEVAIFLILQDDAFLKKDSTGNKMYSNALKQYQAFVKSTKENNAKSLEDSVKKDSSLKPTEKEMIIKARIGQGDFRKSLIEKYAGKCIITGINDKRLLVASHIKPWSVSNNQERIDVENGFLLSPLYDKMFDLGLMTFTDEGQIKLSSTIKQNNRFIINIDTEKSYDLHISSKLKSNLDYHRDVIFLR
ncbi:HNH endonuclease [Treponema sp.]|uniref:HNH endonuclease n=1 Tax=Treponema sp. TaxID=166 RepID=UPI00298DB68A|nr:HNH endonuclease [Treponema sp.]MCQ2240007.1 HNH endonuclease [Treponema sp.]